MTTTLPLVDEQIARQTNGVSDAAHAPDAAHGDSPAEAAAPATTSTTRVLTANGQTQLGWLGATTVASLDADLDATIGDPAPVSHDAIVEQLQAFIGRTIGGVTIDKLVGMGGMGAVFRGTRGIETIPVAIKLMAPWLARTPSLARRFVREAEAQRRLRHPHIVPILDTGQDGDTPFIVMSYMAGGTLRQFLETCGGPLPDDMARRLFRPLLEALDHAHSQGYVHRDIVPGNVLLDADDVPFLSDFGLVSVLGESAANDSSASADSDDAEVVNAEWTSLTQAGAVIGTPPYMSPEQCAGQLLDHRSDLYSFGCLMYRVVCGRPPFVSSSGRELMLMHRQAPVTPPRQLNPAISHDLEAIILRLLEKSPDRRLPVAAEVLRVLEEGYLTDPFRPDRLQRPDHHLDWTAASASAPSHTHAAQRVETGRGGPAETFVYGTVAGMLLAASTSLLLDPLVTLILTVIVAGAALLASLVLRLPANRNSLAAMAARRPTLRAVRGMVAQRDARLGVPLLRMTSPSDDAIAETHAHGPERTMAVDLERTVAITDEPGRA